MISKHLPLIEEVHISLTTAYIENDTFTWFKEMPYQKLNLIKITNTFPDTYLKCKEFTETILRSNAAK